MVCADDAGKSASDKFGEGFQLHCFQFGQTALGFRHFDMGVATRCAVSGKMHEDWRCATIEGALGDFGGKRSHQIHVIADAPEIDDGVLGIQIYVEDRCAGEVKPEGARFGCLNPSGLAAQRAIACSAKSHRLLESQWGAPAVADPAETEEQRDG